MRCAAGITLCLFLTLAVMHAQTSATSKGTHMHAAGPFDVKATPQDDKLNDGLSRMLLEKQYHGQLEATSKGQMLAIRPGNGSGAYVALETITGTLQGKSGSFALYHAGVMSKGVPTLSVNVVPDSGTGQLQGIEGKMTINIDHGKHSYDFEYMLPTE
ncbi:MAG TPA: DUF3224 domain-containing protein [Candidatus Sulfotelmatobacter sp.]|jgi:hypothetical protein